MSLREHTYAPSLIDPTNFSRTPSACPRYPSFSPRDPRDVPSNGILRQDTGSDAHPEAGRFVLLPGARSRAIV